MLTSMHAVSGGGAAAPAFRPLDIPGSLFWFDADHADTATGQFRNQSTGTLWIQETGAQQPTLVSTFNGSLAALSFDGGDSIQDAVDTGVFGGLNGTHPAFSFFALVDLASADALGTLLGTGNTGSSSASNVIIGQINTLAGKYFYQRIDSGGVGDNWQIPDTPGTSPHVIQLRSPGTTGQVFGRIDNGTEVDATDTGGASVAANINAIGCRPKLGNDFFYTGLIRAMGLWSTNLSAGDLTNIRTWLTSHGGL